jgi:hypothetical protein
VIRVDGLRQLRTQLERMDVEAIVQEALIGFADTNLAEASPSIPGEGLVTQDFEDAQLPTAVDRSARNRGLDGLRQARGLDLDRGTPALSTPSPSDLATDRLGPVLAERIAEAFARLLSES